jgi:hypothetical protein
VPRKKGDRRLARLRTLIGRAQQRCDAPAADLRLAHAPLCAIAHLLEAAEPQTGRPVTGVLVRQRVEAALDALATSVTTGAVPLWLQSPVEHLVTVLRRLGAGLYHCYDVPGLPRTNNDLEHFYRHLKAQERRITGHKRSDTFVVRLGGFAVYAAAASAVSEAELRQRVSGVPGGDWQRERAVLRANQERQTQMRRFRPHRTAYLADLEARWMQLTGPP